MFRKILIANRGEIACRIIATAKRLGVATVAVYSDADAWARHVELADEAWPLGPAPARESYLVAEKLVDAARRSGAQAVHPGYGFLSENADFADACAAAGLVFIGPTPRAMRLMGSKAAAKALMEEVGVPTVPGYHGAAQDVATLVEAAERIGFPVLVKASAGGGGKGMRIVREKRELQGAIESAAREALSAFGDGALIVEKRLERPRHIEAQIFGDSHGGLVAFPERDCSIQRRHQKIVEETPAPGLAPQLRDSLRASALAAARAVDYVGAGTVEFLVEDDAYYFLEMNTRLQVEHPITEMIADADLVEWQLRVAAGEPLPVTQERLATRGHAIEARLYAESPALDFLPSVGTLEHLREPRRSACLRVETGVRQGDAITPFYDPMIAKLVAWGDDRAAALARLRGALGECEIVGVETNLRLLKAILDSDDFATATIDTQFLPLHPELTRRAATKLGAQEERLVLAAGAAAWLARARAMAGETPFGAADGWRLNGEAGQKLIFSLEGDAFELRVAPLDDASFRLETEKARVLVEARTSGSRMSLRLDGVKRELSVVARGSGCVVIVDGYDHALDLIDPLAPPRAETAEGAAATSPLPARVTRLFVGAGDEVKKGAPLMTLEAMKMEIALTAPRDGRIVKIACGVGDMVEQGEELVRFAEGEAT